MDNPHVQNLPQFSSAADFADTLHATSLFGDHKQVVLIIDAFDKLYRAPPEVTDSMLDVLRGIKQTKQNYRLHSVVAAGTFSILELAERSSSPFNVREAVQVPFFKEQDFLKVFDEFNTARGNAFDGRIPVDIFGRTKGLYSLLLQDVGRKADDRRTQVSFDEWVEYAALQLPNALTDYATMQKMVDILTEDSARDARNLLTTRFLPANCPIALRDPEEAKLGRFLATEGALVHVDGNTFTIPSPLVHTVLMEKVVSKDKRKPNEPVPFTEELALDIASLIRGTLKIFNSETMHAAGAMSDKQGAGPGIVAGKQVPSEVAYLAELRNVLASWLPTWVVVASEANAPALEMLAQPGCPPRRCDIFIKSAGHRYALELMASGDEVSVKEHIKRLKQYKMVLKAKEGWLIHFTLATAPFLPSPDDLKDGSVKVITASHDFRWTHATMHVTGGEAFRVQLRDD